MDSRDFHPALDGRVATFCAKRGIRNWVVISTLSQLEKEPQTGRELIFFPFLLHRLGERAGDVLRSSLLKTSRLAIVDYRQPERNRIILHVWPFVFLSWQAAISRPIAASCVMEGWSGFFRNVDWFLKFGNLYAVVLQVLFV